MVTRMFKYAAVAVALACAAPAQAQDDGVTKLVEEWAVILGMDYIVAQATYCGLRSPGYGEFYATKMIYIADAVQQAATPKERAAMKIVADYAKRTRVQFWPNHCRDIKLLWLDQADMYLHRLTGGYK